MARSVFPDLKQRFTAWAMRRQQFHEGTLILGQRSIYIVPTRRGFAFAILLLVMLLGDINYILNLGYVLTFLLGTMALMSMLHTFRNMVLLEVRPGRVEPVFAGDQAAFLYHFHNPGKLDRLGLHLQDNGQHDSVFDAPAERHTEVRLQLPATRRGWLHTGPLTLYTEFPLGLFYAWSYVNFNNPALVYPKPVEEAPLPAGAATSGKGTAELAGDEEFTGLRSYAPGDTPQRIAWKALAREQGLQVKQFHAPQGDELWLDWLHAPTEDPERKLAILTRWILDAEAQGMAYGLRLPGQELPAGRGLAHRDDCLRAVALFGLERPP